MKKLLTILALTIVNISLLSGLLLADNNLVISGKVFYKNTTSPVINAKVNLYFVNPDQITCRILETVSTNNKGEYLFTSSLIKLEDKIRIGAYANDIIQDNDRIVFGNNVMTTDEMAELGAYANDLTMDNAIVLSTIYDKTSPVNLATVTNTKIYVYIDGQPENNTDNLGGGIGTYPKGGPILNQNFPNPFNPVTNIQFGISQQAYVSLKVYDMSGKLVAELVNEVKDKGYYTVKFDGANLSSGFYIYRLSAGDFTSIKKMSLIK